MTGALARIIAHRREVTASHDCHFDHFLARRSFKMTTGGLLPKKLLKKGPSRYVDKIVRLRVCQDDHARLG